MKLPNLKGRQGVLIGLTVALFIGLLLGSGAFALPIPLPAVPKRPTPAQAAAAVAGATHG